MEDPTDEPTLSELQRLIASSSSDSNSESGTARLSGLSIPNYEVEEILGQGAMGAVFLARDTRLDREVALKVPVRLDRHQRERFQREAEATAALRHSNVVRIHEVGQGDQPYVAYELVKDARPLDVAVKGLPLEERVRIVRDAARGVGHAHARGILHRDLKPENLLVDPEGRVRVVDFGLAKVEGLDKLTQTGARVGTPRTMSPEQLNGSDLTPASDVYALGVVLYVAIARRYPFDVLSLVELCARIHNSKPVLPRGTPRALSAIVLRAMEVDPLARYPDADAFAHAIDAYLAGPPPADRRPVLLTLIGLSLLAISVALVVAVTPPRVATEVASATSAPSSPPPTPKPRLPAWFRALREPPPLPLPKGVTFGDLPETYIAREGSLLRWIPPRTFTMGLDASETGPETPQHVVTITRGVFMGQHEVTKEQFARFALRARYARKVPPPYRDRTPNEPAANITWADAMAYCQWAGGRLPTEAEWELAATGGTPRRYPWGSRRDVKLAVCEPSRHPRPVGSIKAGASPFGLLDMAGNVWEWVLDPPRDYSSTPQIDPRGPATRTTRVARGGSARTKLLTCRTTKRSISVDPLNTTAEYGFRLCVPAGR